MKLNNIFGMKPVVNKYQLVKVGIRNSQSFCTMNINSTYHHKMVTATQPSAKILNMSTKYSFSAGWSTEFGNSVEIIWKPISAGPRYGFPYLGPALL